MQQTGSNANERAVEGKAVVMLPFERAGEALGLLDGARVAAVRVDVMRQVVGFRLDGSDLSEGATFECIGEVLELPEGIRLVAAQADVLRQVVEFRLDGLGLPLCAEGAFPMRFNSLREVLEWRRGI